MRNSELSVWSEGIKENTREFNTTVGGQPGLAKEERKGRGSEGRQREGEKAKGGREDKGGEGKTKEEREQKIGARHSRWGGGTISGGGKAQ